MARSEKQAPPEKKSPVEKKFPPGIRALERNDGTITYQVRIRLKGHPEQVETFTRLTDAKRWQTQTTAAIREGRHFTTVEAKKHTLGDLIDRYMKDVLPRKPRSEVDQTRQLQWWKDQLGAYALADVTPALIVKARDELARGSTRRGEHRSAGTVNLYLAALSHAYSIAVREWQWCDDSPMRRVSKLKEPRGRVRFLSDDERQRLLKECKRSNPAVYPIAVVAIYTGMRRDEILTLKWADVDLEVGRVILHETKNDERRQVPLAGPSLEVMKAWAKVRRLDTDLVFPGKPDPENPDKPVAPLVIDKMFTRAVKRAGIEDFHFHDCRHTAASYLAMSGATLAEIAEILGHKTLSMVKRYAHLTTAHTASVVERMTKKFGT